MGSFLKGIGSFVVWQHWTAVVAGHYDFYVLLYLFEIEIFGSNSSITTKNEYGLVFIRKIGSFVVWQHWTTVVVGHYGLVKLKVENRN